MEKPLSDNSRHRQQRRLLFFIAGALLALFPKEMLAHQTPNTVMLVDASPDRVGLELQLPLSELELAFGQKLTDDPETIIKRFGPQLKEYLLAHIHAFTVRDNPWVVELTAMRVDKGEQAASGPPFWELNVHLLLLPAPGDGTRQFMLDYDVIIHQVMNHAAFVSVRNDWETGKAAEQPVELGVIRWNMKDNVIEPLAVSLEKGSRWKGFTSMVSLGMSHIREGTDHLLFIIVLLLPAMLLVNGKRWGKFGGAAYSARRLLAIVTAFTIGHSLTLLAGALGWLRLPAQPVEVLVAVSILVSAVHAVYPLFPGREMYVAAGFGLIHGLAFASVLFNLHLGTATMVLSVLGFNIGIELMQLFIIALIVPWLILLSRVSFYKWVRVAAACLAGCAAIAWIAERGFGQSF